MKIAIAVSLTLLLLGCSEDQAQKTKNVTAEESVKMAENVQNITENSIETAQNSLKKIAKEVNVKVVNKSKEVIEETSKTIAKKELTIDGSKIFAKCVSCHGKNAEKKALNKSKVIQGWSVLEVTTAINGYKDGSYGSTMKGVMKPQVNKLSDAEIQAVSEFISNL